jgi:hypothetical protein
MKITICRKSHFNAAHKLYNPIWSKEKNLDVFGRCSYENYHGHNYELIVKFEGEIDQDTGMVMDLSMRVSFQLCFMKHLEILLSILEAKSKVIFSDFQHT